MSRDKVEFILERERLGKEMKGLMGEFRARDGRGRFFPFRFLIVEKNS